MIVVVGGQCRKVGKTSVVVQLIRALPSAMWTALKVTTHHAEQGWTLEKARAVSGDSARYLIAGARESWYLRSSPHALADAMPAVQAIIDKSYNIVIESNSILDHLRPDLYLLVMDPSRPGDVKESALRHASLADACRSASSTAFGSSIDVLIRRPRSCSGASHARRA